MGLEMTGALREPTFPDAGMGVQAVISSATAINKLIPRIITDNFFILRLHPGLQAGGVDWAGPVTCKPGSQYDLDRLSHCSRSLLKE
jgi:hypothetical protein